MKSQIPELVTFHWILLAVGPWFGSLFFRQVGGERHQIPEKKCLGEFSLFLHSDDWYFSFTSWNRLPESWLVKSQPSWRDQSWWIQSVQMGATIFQWWPTTWLRFQDCSKFFRTRQNCFFGKKLRIRYNISSDDYPEQFDHQDSIPYYSTQDSSSKSFHR